MNNADLLRHVNQLAMFDNFLKQNNFEGTTLEEALHMYADNYEGTSLESCGGAANLCRISHSRGPGSRVE